MTAIGSVFARPICTAREIATPTTRRPTDLTPSCQIPISPGTSSAIGGRQGIRLFGVEVSNRLSLTPSLRNGKFQAQPNFVNPGIHLINLGLDADVTPKLKLIHNTNFLWFNHTQVLETYLFTGKVRNFIGTDISLGAEYRPLLNNNVLFVGGIAALISGDGFDDLFQELDGDTRNHIAGLHPGGIRILSASWPALRSFAPHGWSVTSHCTVKRNRNWKRFPSNM